jgi:hypothetical protein
MSILRTNTPLYRGQPQPTRVPLSRRVCDWFGALFRTPAPDYRIPLEPVQPDPVIGPNDPDAPQYSHNG